MLVFDEDEVVRGAEAFLGEELDGLGLIGLGQVDAVNVNERMRSLREGRVDEFFSEDLAGVVDEAGSVKGVVGDEEVPEADQLGVRRLGGELGFNLERDEECGGYFCRRPPRT